MTKTKKQKQQKKKKPQQSTPPAPIIKMPSLDLYKNKGKTTIWAECHTGNNTIFTLDQENSGNFMVGGWSRKAMMMVGDVIIDLTGNKKLSKDIEAQDKIAAKLFKKTISAEKSGTAAILHLYIPEVHKPDWEETA